MILVVRFYSFKDHLFSKYAKSSEKTVSNPFIHTCTCAYQRIRGLRFCVHTKSKLTVFTDFTVFIYSDTSVVFITVLMIKCLFLFKIFHIS